MTVVSNKLSDAGNKQVGLFMGKSKPLTIIKSLNYIKGFTVGRCP